jgi:hypothetical protein
MQPHRPPLVNPLDHGRLILQTPLSRLPNWPPMLMNSPLVLMKCDYHYFLDCAPRSTFFPHWLAFIH